LESITYTAALTVKVDNENFTTNTVAATQNTNTVVDRDNTGWYVQSYMKNALAAEAKVGDVRQYGIYYNKDKASGTPTTDNTASDYYNESNLSKFAYREARSGFDGYKSTNPNTLTQAPYFNSNQPGAKMELTQEEQDEFKNQYLGQVPQPNQSVYYARNILSIRKTLYEINYPLIGLTVQIVNVEHNYRNTDFKGESWTGTPDTPNIVLGYMLETTNANGVKRPSESILYSKGWENQIGAASAYLNTYGNSVVSGVTSSGSSTVINDIFKSAVLSSSTTVKLVNTIGTGYADFTNEFLANVSSYSGSGSSDYSNRWVGNMGISARGGLNGMTDSSERLGKKPGYDNGGNLSFANSQSIHLGIRNAK
jgi:hypothetical protein